MMGDETKEPKGDSAPLPQLIFDPTRGRWLVARDPSVAFELMEKFNRLLVGDDKPSIILASAIVDVVAPDKAGVLIKAIAIPWLEIAREIDRNPDLLFMFTKYPRKFEEFLAAAYDRSGCPNVVLTPQSNDRGCDVIASWPGVGSVKIYDQAKAFAPDRRVTANDVRAMFGVIHRDENVTKGIVTTTSKFAPGVYDEFKRFIPDKLDLIDGDRLLQWIRDLAKEGD